MYKQESNPLHDTFFSRSNYNDILSSIHSRVLERTGRNVDPRKQSEFDLFNIMWSVYSVNSYNYSGDIDRQILKLNSIVVNKVADQVVSGVLMYKQYIHDIYTGPVPNSLPVSTTQYGRKFGTDTRI